MQYYQNRDSGLIYTEEEARNYTYEQLDRDDLAEAMAGHYRLIDLFNLIPEDERAIIIDEAINEKMRWLFNTHIKDDDLMFAHDCPGHKV